MKNPFLPQSLMLETIATEDLANVEILDAKWEDLKNIGRSASFHFNVEIPAQDGSPATKDSCGSSGPEPAYKVSFSGDDRSAQGVGIAFYRCHSVADVGGGFGNQVFLAVQKAIYDFVKARKPYAISWSPVEKSSGEERYRKDGTNTRGRVYEMLSRTHLFPEYVSYRQNHWLRKDLYDKFAVPEGYPAMSEDISKSSTMRNKVAEIQRMRDEARKAPDEAIDKIYQKVSEYGLIEKAKDKEESLKDVINDPEQNPNQLRINDLVNVDTNYPEEYQRYVDQESSHHWVKKYISSGRDYGKIVDMMLSTVPWTGGDKEILLGKVFLVNTPNDDHGDHSQFNDYYVWLPLKILEKFKQEGRAEKSKQRFRKLLDDPYKNPLKLDYGSEIIYMPTRIAKKRNIAYGDIYKIDKFIDQNLGLQYEASYVKNAFIENIREFVNDEGLVEKYKLYFTPTGTQKIEITEYAGNYNEFTILNSSNLAEAKQNVISFIERTTDVFSGDNFFGVKEGDKVVATKGDLFIHHRGFRCGQIGKVVKLDYDEGTTRVEIEWTPENVLKDVELYQQISKSLLQNQSKTSHLESNYNDINLAIDFRKLSDSAIEEAHSSFEEAYKIQYLRYVENPSWNPDNIRIGDIVLISHRSTNHSMCGDLDYFGCVGKIESLKIQYDDLQFTVVIDREKTKNVMPQDTSPYGIQSLYDKYRIGSRSECARVIHYTPANVLLHKKLAHMFDTSRDVRQARSNLNTRLSEPQNNTTINGQNIQYDQKVKVAAGYDRGEGEPFVGIFKGVEYGSASGVEWALVYKKGKGLFRIRKEKIAPLGRPELRSNYLQQIQSSSLKIGDAVKVSRGIHANKNGHIINYGPKKSFAGAYAIVKTMPDDNTPSEKIVINLDDLVPSDELSKVESYKAILNRMNRYFEWKNK